MRAVKEGILPLYIGQLLISNPKMDSAGTSLLVGLPRSDNARDKGLVQNV